MPMASAWNTHPTTRANGLYKFFSVELNLHQQKRIITRQTYDLLQFLGDVGGLVDCLWIIGKFILIPYTSYSLKQLLLLSLFRM